MDEQKHLDDLRKKKRWIDMSITGLCVVAVLGVILRSKILFSMPFFDYNRLLDAHFHFAFSGWVTLALVTLMTYDILPEEIHNKAVYQRSLTGIVLAAWLQLLSSPLPPNNPLTSFFSTVFILSTYVFAWVFISDVKKAGIKKAVKLLAVSSLVFLVLASSGIFWLAYLFASKSLNSGAYRDALYTYLHFEYNGFFTLAVFAVVFNKLESRLTIATQQKLYRFAVLLCVSIVSSLFLTFLWKDPNVYYRVMAVIGSISLLVTVVMFTVACPDMDKACKTLHPVVKYMAYMAVSAFALKTLLQSFTIFPAVGDAVFGDRPVIIGFLHLVFLGFVSLMLLAYFAETGLLNIEFKLTQAALILFTAAVILNEAVLMTQGLGAMFIESSYIFPWLLWALSILLFISALLTGAARIKTNRYFSRSSL